MIASGDIFGAGPQTVDECVYRALCIFKISTPKGL